MPLELPQSADYRALFTLADIDKATIYEIENAKTQLQLHYNEYEIEGFKAKLEELLSAMASLMLKYSDNYYTRKMIKVIIANENREYSFKDLIDYLDSEEILSKNTLKFIMQNAYLIYNRFLKEYLKVSLHLDTEKPKKKAFNRLYSLIGYNSIRLEYEFNLDYEKRIKELGLKDKPLNWLSYLLSQGYKQDLDFTILIFGYSRIGKSTLALHIVRRILAFKLNKSLKEIDNYLTSERLKEILFYDKNDLERAKTLKENFRWFDEAIFIGDKRESMDTIQINLLKILNAYAKYHNINIIVIQDPLDLDSRLLKKTNIIIPVITRGEAQAHILPKNFSFLKDIFPLKDLASETYTFLNLTAGKNRLRAIPSFVFNLNFKDIADFEVYKRYDAIKDTTYTNKEFKKQEEKAIDITSVINILKQKQKV
jgi:hypothetical protein